MLSLRTQSNYERYFTTLSKMKITSGLSTKEHDVLKCN